MIFLKSSMDRFIELTDYEVDMIWAVLKSSMDRFIDATAGDEDENFAFKIQYG